MNKSEIILAENQKVIDSAKLKVGDLFEKVLPVITFVFDVSGSMRPAVFEAVYEIMDEIVGKAKINLLQWDTLCRYVGEYKKGDGKKMQIYGRAGTDMDACLKFLQEDYPIWKGALTFIVTDGHIHEPKTPDDNIHFLIVAETEKEFKQNSVKGFNCIQLPWPVYNADMSK